jgi:hypothetical protein
MTKILLAPLAALLSLLALAAPAEGKGGTGQVAVYATTTGCQPWSLAVTLRSTSVFAVLHVDVRDDTGMVAVDVPLSYNQPLTLALSAAGSKDTISAFVHNSSQELGRYQALNPCTPA